ncbi:MAG: hypothetical protein Q8P18_19335 [Pseudomonadota bacterium]|nr:hypothetical protein [Pseudomonadota bacterium]
MFASLLLLACADKPDTDTTGDTTGGDTAGDGVCHGGPDILLAAPAEGATYAYGEVVTLDGSGTSAIGDVVEFLWAVNGDLVQVGASGTWTADVSGALLLTFQGEDSCGITQEDVYISVGAPDPDDTGTPDDTGVVPAEASVTPFGAEAGLPAGTWSALSVGADGIVWAASTAGLVRLDPALGTSRVYGAADGLLSDSPTAVLAHSNGSVWVGHVGTVERQGEQISVSADGTLTVLQPIDYTESSEILAVLRLREQAWGAGAGDVWMGTNEGLCLWDQDVARFAEHAHPTHPHGYSAGVAFSADGDVWNGDAYQLSRWRYSNDGDLSPSADLLETVPTWPVQIEEPLTITDLDIDGDTLWVASSLFGVAQVSVGAEAGGSPVNLYAEPATARAVRADGLGNVWIGGDSGLYRWDGTLLNVVTGDWVPADGVQQITVDRSVDPAAVWFGTSAGLVRVIGVPG